MSKLIDLTGQRFGRWLVLERAGTYISPGDICGSAKASLWRCRCDCGNQGIVFSRNLRSGSSQSCGCLRNDKRKRKL